jgi:hypothetical protein
VKIRANCCFAAIVSGFGALFSTRFKKKRERNTSLALHTLSARAERGFWLAFSSSLSFQGGEKRRDLIPILFPKRERKERAREKREKSLDCGEKSNNKKDEGRQTATAAAAKDD